MLPFKNEKPAEVRYHRYLVTVFGPAKAHEVVMRTQEMYINLNDLHTAKQHVLDNLLPEGHAFEELSIASVSYLGYTSDSEFGIKEVTDGEPVEK